MNVAYIMRGIQGSGKSSLAKQLAGQTGVIHSTDEYFYVGDLYVFDASKLREYHQKNLNAFCESLAKGVSVVICDNTNVRKEHIAPYLLAAEKAGYRVAIVTLPHPTPEIAASRTIHHVPIDVIRQTIDQWEY